MTVHIAHLLQNLFQNDTMIIINKKLMFARNTNNMKKSRKNWLKFTAAILTMAGTVSALAACNKETEQPGPGPGPDPVEETTTVSLIYDGMGVSMDFDGMLEKEADELAQETYGSADVKSYGVEDGKFQVLSMVGDSLSSVVVELPEETLNYLNGDVKENVLDRAQLTADQQVKESERQQIVDRLTSAVEYIEGQIGNISNLPASRVNYYADGETQENVNNETLFSVLGPVLADGSFIRYDVRENGNLFETVIIVPNADGKTEQQIYEAYFSGNYSLGSSTEVDLDAEYTPPTPADPDNPGPDNPGGDEDEETITIGEIFDQNFANIDFSDKLNEMFIDVVKIGYADASSVDPMFYVENGSQTTVYYEMVRGGRTYFGGMTFPTPDGLPSNENFEDIILAQLGLDGSSEVSVDDVDRYIALMRDAINSYDVSSIIDGITMADLQNKIYGSATNNTLPAASNAFGEALMEDMGAEGTIIATYVGDMGGRHIDAADMFENSGYYTQYTVTVVYQNESGITITTCDIYNAWFTNSTNESLYGNLLNGTNDYQLGSPTTITIDNPTATATASSDAGLVIG